MEVADCLLMSQRISKEQSHDVLLKDPDFNLST